MISRRQDRLADHAQDLLPRRSADADMSPTQHSCGSPPTPRSHHQRRGLLRQIQELATRRNLIRIGETWSTSPSTRRSTCRRALQIEDAERRLFELAEAGRYDAASSLARRCAARSRWRRRLPLRAVSISDRSTSAWRPVLGLLVILVTSGDGKTRSRPTSLHHRRRLSRRGASDGTLETVDGGIVGFFAEMSSEQLATRIPSEQAEIPEQDPSRRHFRRRVRETGRRVADDAVGAAYMSTRPAASRSLHKPCARRSEAAEA